MTAPLKSVPGKRNLAPPFPGEETLERDVPTRFVKTTDGVHAAGPPALLRALARPACSYALVALERLSWDRRAGWTPEPESLRQRLGVADEHRKLFRRMFELLAAAGVLEIQGDGFGVVVGADDPLPAELPADPEELADRMAARYPHGSNEIGCSGARRARWGTCWRGAPIR